MLSTTAFSEIGNSTFGQPESAYIHIPFCRRRCYYCDFPIAVVGDRPPLARQQQSNGFNTIAQYVSVLCQEIRLIPGCDRTLKTIFFGGGTPSLLTVEQLNQILATLNQQFGIAEAAEISIEIDPATFDLAQLQGYRTAGVNRVSLGVQAFQAELLKACGRSHTPSDIQIAVEIIDQAGIDNFSLDLISGLPNQTLEHWQESVEQAIALAPTHLSCYDLTIEPGTAFSRQYKPGMKPLPSDEMTAEMYRLVQRQLTTAGYEHYEISNYAKPGYQCRHNRVYWENHSFYGFGMGATSYIEGYRFARPRKTWEYYEWVKTIELEAKLPSQPDTLSSSELLLDTLMLGLRLSEGLRIETLIQQFGQTTFQKIWHCLQPYCEQGWVEVVNPELSDRPEKIPTAGQLRLTDPEGFLFSNVLLSALFEEFE